MGEYADEIIDRMMFPEDYTPTFRPRGRTVNQVPSGMWRSSQGLLEISKMTNLHLRNAYQMAKRHENHAKMRELSQEMERRGVRYVPA